jgi:hypothetical protein
MKASETTARQLKPKPLSVRQSQLPLNRQVQPCSARHPADRRHLDQTL